MIKKIAFSALVAVSFSLQAQQVTLFAGSQYVGDGAYSGATGAINKLQDSFSMPWGIAADTNGRFWITDQHNASLVISTLNYVKGGSTADPNLPGSADYADKTGTVSRFANPAGCEVNPVNNRVYICDADNNVIRYQNSSVINNTDAVVWGTFAGVRSFLGGYKDGSTSVAEFGAPQDIAISSTGVVYIADRDNHCIRKISGGTVSTIAGLGETSGDANGTGSSARFYAPTGVFLVDDNTLLVADRNNGKIKQVTLPGGVVTTVVSGLNFPTDMVKVNGVIYIADSYCIRAWDGNNLKDYAGKYNVSGYVNASDVSARFRNLTTMCYHDKTKSMYVADMGNNVFRQVTVIQPVVADFNANKTGVTVGEIVTLTSTSSNATAQTWKITPTNYTLQNGSVLTDKTIMVSFDQTGSYTVELTATNPSSSDKMTKSNYINVSLIGGNKPNPDFYADKTVAAIAEVVSFIDQTTDNPLSFLWTFTPATVTYENGTNNTTRFPKVSFNNPGKYTVELAATNTNGTNKKIRTDYITISGVGVKEIRNTEMSLFPNPAADMLNLGGDYSQVTVIDCSGKSVSLSAKTGWINISNLSPGVYTILASGNDNVIYHGRFVKTAN